MILGSGRSTGSLLLSLPMSLPLSVCLSWINKIFKKKSIKGYIKYHPKTFNVYQNTEIYIYVNFSVLIDIESFGMVFYISFYTFFFKDFIYSWETHREGQRHRQREKQAPCGSTGPQDHVLSQRQMSNRWATQASLYFYFFLQ